MKKNITINLFGSLYAIDEDAYELLNQYQNNMRRYFSRKEGGEEIAEDIERRIAELFDELKASGVEAITIEHVRDIISRIGNPEEMDGTETEATADETDDAPKESERKENVHKKLFRNPDDKMLGGVTSGLACYFGIDPLWLRLLMILFAWFSLGTSIIIYLILWIIIPEAWTPEDRLRMQGRPVNMENLRDEIIDGARKAGQYASAPKTQKTVRGCLTVLLDIQRFPFPRRRRYPPLRYNHVNRHPHRVLPVLLFRFYGWSERRSVQFACRTVFLQCIDQRQPPPRHLLDGIDKFHHSAYPHFVYRYTFHPAHGGTHTPHDFTQTVGPHRRMDYHSRNLYRFDDPKQHFLRLVHTGLQRGAKDPQRFPRTSKAIKLFRTRRLESRPAQRVRKQLREKRRILYGQQGRAVYRRMELQPENGI